MRQKEKPLSRDQRTIPTFFRASSKSPKDQIYYGCLITEDGFNFTTLACHDAESSHLKERILPKHEFTFTRITKDEFSMHSKRCLSLMAKLTLEKRYEFEAEEYLLGCANLQFKEAMAQA